MKILLIDSQFFTRAGLIHLCTSYSSELSIYEAPSFELATEYLQHDNQYNLIFLDMDLPDAEIRPSLALIKKHAPTAHVVLFCWSRPMSEVRQAMASGVRSYLPKDSSAEDAKIAIRTLLKNDRYLPDESRLTDISPRIPQAENFLSPRQLEIMQLLAQGLSNKEIATILGITEGTIRVHLSTIFKAIKVSNRTEATLWYLLRQKRLVS
ncbi:DNA-binding response regulator [Pseudidiomarina sediminum]|uniref:DNA-binding response regulator n=1 Tax=Pseudidiomarina sediminum TaxID=431675 RepID=A0A432YZF2_9GAMM|nr:response regulator transcription factor [Pseudidiomarina sediminum]MBY6064973.1 response regulator transcription factor [Pseudidiomarina sediminum]RUO68975.1 DNA-binding response regulator [Pseudidiomarina sediminum]